MVVPGPLTGTSASVNDAWYETGRCVPDDHSGDAGLKRREADPQAGRRRVDKPAMSGARRRAVGWVVVPAGLAAVCAVALIAAGNRPAAALALVASTTAALVAGAMCASAARRVHGRARYGWVLMAAGCGSWGWGNGFWTYNELVRHSTSLFPSAADIGFLMFPVAGTAGLWLISARSALGSRLTAVLDGIVVAGALFLILWAVSLRELVTNSAQDHVAFLISLAYPAGDLVLATMACLLAARTHRRSRAVVMTLVVGLLAMATADVMFAVATAGGSYRSGSWPDVAWTAAFCTFALAAWLTRRRPMSVNAATRVERWQVLLPYVPFAVSIAVGGGAATNGRKPDPPEVVVILLVFVCLLVRQLITVLSHTALAERLRHEASHDALTGLTNRPHFVAALDRSLADRTVDGPPIGVLYINLDNFTWVNDTLGHHVGDELLRELAQRLRLVVPETDTIARLGGDEFAVMVANGRDVHAVAHGVAAAVRGPFALGSHTVAMTASISVATSPPSDGLPVSGEELRKHVDLAMQAAKENGKDTITAFEPAMRTRLDTEMALRAELDKALADGALHVVYQPIVRLPCMEPAGVEALARWHHPVLGQVSPAEFIAVAERTGLIHSLGLFVLDRACEEFAAWDTEGSKYLSVNVSTLQLLDPGFPDRVSARRTPTPTCPPRRPAPSASRRATPAGTGEGSPSGSSTAASTCRTRRCRGPAPAVARSWTPSRPPRRSRATAPGCG